MKRSTEGLSAKPGVAPRIDLRAGQRLETPAGFLLIICMTSTDEVPALAVAVGCRMTADPLHFPAVARDDDLAAPVAHSSILARPNAWSQTVPARGAPRRGVSVSAGAAEPGPPIVCR